MDDAISGAVAPPAGAARQAKFAYIDAVRGWAILLVITNHVGSRFVELAYPVKKLTNYGWFGVQLFFLASAVTLCFSWRRDRAAFGTKTRHFFIRRFLRIAPMYYLAALFYALVWPPAGQATLGHVLSTLLFVNAWTPEGIPTTPGWTVVPGGWSIGVEFTFYAMFPLLLAMVTSLKRALGFLAATLAGAVACNTAALAWFGGTPAPALSHFLYFWMPNQLPVFALGIVLFYALSRAMGGATWPAWRGNAAGAAIFLGIAGVAEHPWHPDYFSAQLMPPAMLPVSLLLAAFVFVLARAPGSLFTHGVVRRIGVLSFSCCILHFYFVAEIPNWSAGLIDPSATGVRAILLCGVLWVATVAATCLAGTVTHRFIEQPGIMLARRLCARKG